MGAIGYTMTRSIGEVEAIQALLPDWTAPLVALLTQLGDIWFLVLVLAVLYWTRVDRQDSVILVGGMLVASIGLYRALKHTFRLPRPDEPLLDPELLPWVVRPLYEATAFSGSYGFPSGHAIVSTVVYVGLAAVLESGTRRLRYAIAGCLVALVGFTRMALGLHFLVDIVAGIALGLGILYVGLHGAARITGDRNTVLLFVAIVLTALYLFASDVDIEAVIVFGAALGLFGGWQLIALARELVAISRPSSAGRPVVVRGVLAVLSLGPLVVALEEFPLLSGEPYPAGAVAGLVVAVLVIVPVARYSARVRRLLAVLSFWSRATAEAGRAGVRRVRRWLGGRRE